MCWIRWCCAGSAGPGSPCCWRCCRSPPCWSGWWRWARCPAGPSWPAFWLWSPRWHCGPGTRTGRRRTRTRAPLRAPERPAERPAERPRGLAGETMPEPGWKSLGDRLQGDGGLAQATLVGAGVVPAEQQLASVGQYRADLGSGPAAVAALTDFERTGPGQGRTLDGGHRRLQFCAGERCTWKIGIGIPAVSRAGEVTAIFTRPGNHRHRGGRSTPNARRAPASPWGLSGARDARFADCVFGSVQVVAQHLGPRRVAQLRHGLRLDLPDPLPGDPVDLADLVQRARLAVGEPEA